MEQAGQNDLADVVDGLRPVPRAKAPRKKTSMRVQCPVVVRWKCDVNPKDDPTALVTILSIVTEHSSECVPSDEQLRLMDRRRGNRWNLSLLTRIATKLRGGCDVRSLRGFIIETKLALPIDLRSLWNLRYAVKYAEVGNCMPHCIGSSFSLRSRRNGCHSSTSTTVCCERRSASTASRS